jgi:hypothetical protein
MRLAFGVVVPVDELGPDQPADAGRHVNEDARILAASFEQQNLVGRIFRQAVRQHAACAAGADDDVVEITHVTVRFPVAAISRKT